jgi:hypothetical protein
LKLYAGCPIDDNENAIGITAPAIEINHTIGNSKNKIRFKIIIKSLKSLYKLFSTTIELL